MRGAVASVAIASLAACGVFDPEPLPPHGEALVIVDTDLPVPMIVSRLRVDVFAEDGTWIAHRDDLRPDPRDWPTSFSVWSDDPARAKTLRLRLRAYLDGRTVTYRGSERLADGPTPEFEPDPALAVDKTVELRLVHGVRGRVRVLLGGACVGGKSCLEVESPALEPTMARDTPSAVGTFGLERCSAPSADGRICIPGGVFVLGDPFYRLAFSGLDTATTPERVVRLSRFELDRDEVSVARFRRTLAAGFVPPHAVTALEADGPPALDLSKACTWSATPRGREDYPLSCVSFITASAFCRFEGGDLPSEAQWEYATLAAGRTRKAIHPWGDEPPTCERAVYGRVPFRPDCVSLGEGPAPLADNGDVTPLGVRHLAGSLEELLRDRALSYAAPCWTEAPLLDPVCERPNEAGTGRSVRGGNWASDTAALVGVMRNSVAADDHQSPLLGFRCAYPVL